jgi:hypothetical protein
LLTFYRSKLRKYSFCGMSQEFCRNTRLPTLEVLGRSSLYGRPALQETIGAFTISFPAQNRSR